MSEQSFVFCVNCKFHCHESEYYRKTIIVRNHKTSRNYDFTTLLCNSNIEIKKTSVRSYFKEYRTICVILDDCSILNSDNKCTFFKPSLDYFIELYLVSLFSKLKSLLK